MPNSVRIGVQTTGVPKTVSEIDQVRDRFRKAAYDINKAGKEGGFAFGAAAGVAAKGVEIIGASAYKAGQAIGDFIHDSISAASDLNESVSKSQVIFGDAAGAVADFASTADKSLGLSKQAALEAAASFGNLFLGTGKTQAEAAQLSTRLVTLAGDLASFNNLDPTVTLEKLRSGLTGEAEPLRSVGVFLTEAKVKAKGMELGLADAHGELSEGAKVMARYRIILDETKTAQGDFGRTADGVANSQRILAAEIENTKAKLGEKLLPVEKTWLDLQLRLVTGIDRVADGLSGNLSPSMIELAWNENRLNLIQGAVHDQIHTLGIASLQAAHEVGILSDAEFNTEMAARAAEQAHKDLIASTWSMAHDTRESNVIAAGSIRAIGTEATHTATKMETANDRMKRSANSLASTLLADSQKIVSDYYDVLTTEDDLSGTNAEIAAQRRIIASSSSTKAEIRDAKVKLHSLEATQSQLEQTLASHGATTSKAFTKTMADLLARLAHAHGKERAAILAEIAALNLLSAKVALSTIFDKGSTYHTFGGGQASGGPVSKGTAYVVGEEGPELFVPGASGNIIPNDALAGGSAVGMGGGINVNVSLNGGGWTPGSAQQFANEVGPILANWLQKRQLLKKAG